MVRALLNLSARVIKSSIYFCEKYCTPRILNNKFSSTFYFQSAPSAAFFLNSNGTLSSSSHPNLSAGQENILLTKITAAQSEVAHSYHKVRGYVF